MRIAGVVMAGVLASGCVATGPVKPLQDAREVSQLTDEDSRLWTQARDLDEAVRKSGQIYPDEKLRQYLQQVMDRLFPEFQGAMRVQVLKSPILNAFALPNGSIYVHIGLLARLDNEAQLAAVLAHEGTHFVEKHGLRQQQTVKSAAAFRLGVALMGVPLVGDLLAISSIYGYSQDLERAADSGAFQRLVRAGYDRAESVKVFEHLQAEVKALGVDEPFFFSSHPRLQERIESFQELIGSAGPSGQAGEINQEAFLGMTRPVRIASVEADLSMNRCKSVILVMESERAAEYFAPQERHYYLGEAYRLRAEEGDAERAEAAFRKATETDAMFAPAHRALGVHYLKNKRADLARVHIRKYLDLAPAAPDRAFMEQYLNTLELGGQSQ